MRARLGTGPAPGPAVVSLADYEARAQALLPPQVWDFAAGGAGAETALRANRQALDAVVVYPRVLAGGGRTDTATSLLGTPAALPVAVAPMAYQRLMHPAGEVAMAEAARRAGVPMMLSALSSCPVEEVAGTGVALWFQLYWLAERHALERLIERAEDAGIAALVVTLDVPVLGRRLRDVRNEFALPAEVVAANLTDGSGSRAHVAHRGESALAAHTSSLFGSALGWADLEWLRDRTSLPLALKGILDPRDARRAVDLGADAIVVSNHGGRQLDAAPASVAALPAVVSEVGQQCQVLLDSGIRSGTDVLRALALGAAGVLVGRPLLWALAVDGAAGAESALALLNTEIQESLILAGCPDLAAVRDLRTTQESCR
ncbi:alpha-hydroxy acid oxidase [Jatrophihabitans sp.]|uniref:alpha-hydroxy acid oxidase n=1 Tax=Jatrophihabitans sp. TaxID=1932789 RepID=UPI0038CD51EA